MNEESWIALIVIIVLLLLAVFYLLPTAFPARADPIIAGEAGFFVGVLVSCVAFLFLDK